MSSCQHTVAGNGRRRQGAQTAPTCRPIMSVLTDTPGMSVNTLMNAAPGD
ncbi:hypothetical protein JQS43_24270 [Natronosporangium hydrolyticum]|uniref:Uncharacterized protein n=1 Tax=Natronosporangium hydrolyticum TaxID=2811111 RepID=A0A895YEH8_9ACTN|nr:hypothetical protein [Natronosporangium hydrolyticum]QSB14552.1 hypothetical protein JQS43_24270 [Natronosporangium hydrolyticum]